MTEKTEILDHSFEKLSPILLVLFLIGTVPFVAGLIFILTR